MGKKMILEIGLETTAPGPTEFYIFYRPRTLIDRLVQDCSNSSALAKELLQSCTKPSIHAFVCGKSVTSKNITLN